MRRGWIILSLGVLTACASLPAGQVPTAGCRVWPPGVSPEIQLAPVLEARSGWLASPAVAATRVVYEYPPAHIALIWVGEFLASVDPEWLNPASVPWIDPGVLTLNGQRLQDAPIQTCRWRRLAV